MGICISKNSFATLSDSKVINVEELIIEDRLSLAEKDKIVQEPVSSNLSENF